MITILKASKSGGTLHVRRKLALTAAALSLTIAASAAEAPALTANPLTVARATSIRQGDVMGNRLARARSVPVQLALKMRNRDLLEQFIAKNSVGGSGVAEPMSREQMIADHWPTVAQAQAVVNFLERSGFRNIEVSENRMLVSAEGTADVVESAFKTTLMQVTTRDGRDAHANTDAVTIPAELQDIVLSAGGLQTVHAFHTFARVIAQPNAVTPLAVTGHNPNDWASIYSATSLPTGAGVTVGILTQGRITQTITDLNTFTANNGLPTVTTQTVNTNGTSTDTRGVVEWNLDSQDIVGAAGGQVGKIIFYNVPTLANTNITADVNTAVTANAAKIINVSLGECELDARSDGSAAAQDQSFAMAVAQGQTFSISTGDTGADECGDGGITPSWPAASQFVMAVSGTKLDASTTTWNSEVVWNNGTGNAGATGGSQSTFEPKPSWQNGFVSGSFRGVADVAFSGDPNSGARIIVNGGTQQVGGTSLSAPIFAGLWSRVIASKGTSVGFAAPLIYALPASDFHDITVGNNNGVSSGPGYDLVTGRGSLIMSSAIQHIGTTQPPGNVAPVANFSFTTSGLTATFTDASSDSDGSIVSRSWNFGDGTTSTAVNPSHTYTAAGTFNVTLTVTDNGGLTGSKTSSVSVANAGNKFFQNTTPQAINDNTTITSSIPVSGLTGPVTSTLKINVNITHTFIGDLVIVIVAPNGATATLWNRQGGSTDNLNMTFTVNASGLSTANGTWQLRVSDRAAGDVGRLNSWSLQF